MKIAKSELTEAEAAAYAEVVGKGPVRGSHFGLMYAARANSYRTHRYARTGAAMARKLWLKGWLVIVDHDHAGRPIYRSTDTREEV